MGFRQSLVPREEPGSLLERPWLDSPIAYEIEALKAVCAQLPRRSFESYGGG